MISEKDKYNFKVQSEYYENFNSENITRLELFDAEVVNFKIVNTAITQLSSIHGKLTDVFFIDCKIINSELRLTEFKNCHFKNVQFEGCILSKVNFSKCIFENCSIESQYEINQDEFILFDNCYINELDMSKSRISPAFHDVITDSICGNLTIHQNAIDVSKNIILQRKSTSAATTTKPEVKRSAPVKASKPAAKEAKKDTSNEIKKIGDTEKAQESGSFADRFGGIEFNKKKSEDES